MFVVGRRNRAWLAGAVVLSACTQGSKPGEQAISPIAAGGASFAGAPAMSGGAGGVLQASSGGFVATGGAQPSASGGQPGGAPAGGAPSSIGGASGGGTAGVIGSGAAGASGAGGAVPVAPDPNTVIIKMDPFTVDPGAEVFMCQDFDNPFGGADVAVGRSESIMTSGSHHLHVYYGTDGDSRTAAPCPDPNEFRPMIHLATIPDFVSQYPAGMAAKLKGTTGLRTQAHYVNTTGAPLDAQVAVEFTKVEPSTVTKWVGQMHFNRTVLSVPPGMGQVVSTSCSIPSTFGSIGLINGVSHMHRRGVHFVASTSNGTTLIDTTEWDEAPPSNYDPPVMVNPGDSITWTCTYDNDTGTTITFGDSATKNEMCIYIARFFSSPNGDDLTCETPYAKNMAVAAAPP